MREKHTAKPDATELALDRTVLANERTFQAWIRTGLSALVSGLGVAKFLKNSMPEALVLTITAILILLSILAFLQASWRYHHLHVRMSNLNVDTTPMWIIRTISLLLAGCGLLALFGIYSVVSG